MTEGQVLRSIVNYVRCLGGFAIKLHGSAMSGKTTLDLIGSLGGKPFVCEVKRPGKRPTLYHQHQLKTFASGGYVALWADSLDMFKAKIHRS